MLRTGEGGVLAFCALSQDHLQQSKYSGEQHASRKLCKFYKPGSDPRCAIAVVGIYSNVRVSANAIATVAAKQTFDPCLLSRVFESRGETAASFATRASASCDISDVCMARLVCIERLLFFYQIEGEYRRAE